MKHPETKTVISILFELSRPIKMWELAMRAKVTERKLRLIIADIRENNLIDGYVLCSDDCGYWISNDADEINGWLARYLSYAYSIIAVARCAKSFLSEQHKKDIQLSLNF